MIPEPSAPIMSSQTIDGYTLRVTNLRWISLQDMEPRHSWPDPYVKVLEVEFDVQSTNPDAAGKSAEELAKHVRNVRLIGPRGERVEAQGNGQKTVFYADPRWDKVTLECDFEDPSAPPEVAGPFEDTLEFKNLPMPQQLDKPLTINRSATTPRGTRFVIENAITRVVEQDGGMQGELAFSIAQRSTPGVSLSAWSVSPSAGIRVVKLMDADGKDLTGSLVDEGSIRPDDAFPERMVFCIRPLPPKTQSLRAQVEVKEKPQQLPEKWQRHFRVQLPMPPISTPFPTNNYKPSRIATGKIADVSLEKVLVEKFGSQSQYSARVWIRDKRESLLPAWQRDWIFKRSVVRWLRGGNEVESDMSRSDPVRDAAAERIYWKANGLPIGPNEVGLRMGSFASPEARPKKFTYEFTLEAVRKVQHKFHFSDVPIPKPGEVLEPNAAFNQGNAARLVIRKVAYIRNESDWKTLNPNWNGPAPSIFLGLVVVCRLEQDSSGGDGSKATIVLSGSAAKDNTGQTLLSRPDTRAFPTDFLSQKTGRTYNDGTFVLVPPASGAKSFNIQIAAEETLPTGEQETFVLPNVNVPQK